MPTLNNDTFLVLRRDGTVAEDVFVLDPDENPAASAALLAWANASEILGIVTPGEAEQFRVLAASWGNRPSPGTPPKCGTPNPNIVGAIEQPPVSGVQALVYGPPPGPPTE